MSWTIVLVTVLQQLTEVLDKLLNALVLVGFKLVFDLGYPHRFVYDFVIIRGSIPGCIYFFHERGCCIVVQR